MIKKKRGASLAESVVALAVITIVSMAAISAVVFALNAQVKALRNTKAQDFARSVFESFKVSDDYSAFVNNLSFAEDITALEANEDKDGSYTVYEYISSDYDFRATIKVYLPDDVSHESEGTKTDPKLSVVVTENSDPDDEIIFFDYTKGGGT